MIKALSLAAALALLPMSAAVADDARGPAEDAIQAAAEAFEARMEAFGERAEIITGDASLTEAQRETRIAALWSEYQPDVNAFTATVSEHAAAIAGEALAGLDIDAIVTEALSEVEASGALSGALAGAHGMAANGAWASNDPEHMATYGLMADYAVGSALDTLDESLAEVDEAMSEVDEALADEASDVDEDEDEDEASDES